MHALRAKPKKEWKDKKSGKGTTKMFLTLWNASLIYTYTCIYIHSRSSPGRRYCHLLLQEQDHFTIAEPPRTEQCHCSSGRGELCLKTHTKNHVVRIAIKQHPRQKEEKAANSYNRHDVPDAFCSARSFYSQNQTPSTISICHEGTTKKYEMWILKVQLPPDSLGWGDILPCSHALRTYRSHTHTSSNVALPGNSS